MCEKFTDRVRKVMQLANQEAQRFNHEYIGTEHILLGLVREGNGIAVNVLKNLDIDLRKIRLEVEKLMQCGPDMTIMGKLPQTPRAKKVIEYSMEEAVKLGHKYVGVEHILLGLLRKQEGVAAQVLMNLGLKLEEVREEVLNLLVCETRTKPSSVVMIDTKTGFTEAEARCHDSLMVSCQEFIDLPRQHPDEMRDFVDAVHRIQDLLAVRIVRREYPGGWTTYEIKQNEPG